LKTKIRNCEKETHIAEILLEEIVKLSSVLNSGRSTTDDNLHDPFVQFQASREVKACERLTK